MSKIFKTVSTIMIAVGLFFLSLYVQGQGGSRLDILEQPSYYMVQSYGLIFVAGIVVLLFSLLGSFFSWFKEFDGKEEILPNAGYASDQEIRTWVGGADEASADATEIMRGDTEGRKQTELLSGQHIEKTSIIDGRDRS